MKCSHNCARASFCLLWTELIRIVKLAHFVLGSAYERPASERPTVYNDVRSPMAGFVRFAIDGFLRWSQVLTDADTMTSVTRQRTSSCFATTCSTDSVAQPCLHNTGSRYVKKLKRFLPMLEHFKQSSLRPHTSTKDKLSFTYYRPHRSVSSLL